MQQKLIGLFNIDSKKIQNLALLKVEKYYKDKGYEIVWDNKVKIPYCEEIYVSCVFTENKHECKFFEDLIPRLPNVKIHIGGSGYDIFKQLPPEIDQIKVHQNFGFTSRGCIRNCEFCIVPRKEGKFHIVGDICDLWDGKSDSITLMDNNIFSNFEHFKMISEQLIKNNLKVDFNQGLDIRLLNEDFIQILKNLKPISTWKFSFDSLKYKNAFIKGSDLIKKYKMIEKCQIFLLCGFDTTIQEDFERIEILNKYRLNTFFMLFDKGSKLIGEPTEEQLLMLKKLRAPTGNKLKYLRILNLNNKNLELNLKPKKEIKTKKLF